MNEELIPTSEPTYYPIYIAFVLLTFFGLYKLIKMAPTFAGRGSRYPAPDPILDLNLRITELEERVTKLESSRRRARKSSS